MQRSPREIIAEAAVVLSVCIGAWFLLIDQRAAELRTLEAQIRQVEGVPSATIEHAIADFATRAHDMRSRIRAIKLRSGFDTDSFLLYDTIMARARDSGVKIERLNPADTDRTASNREVTSARISLSIKAPYGNVAAFLAALRSVEAFVRPVSVRLMPVFSEPGVCTGQIECEFVSFNLPESLLATIAEAEDGGE